MGIPLPGTKIDPPLSSSPPPGQPPPPRPGKGMRGGGGHQNGGLGAKYHKNIELPRQTAKIHILNTASTFYDVYNVFGPKFDPFLHFPSRLKVKHAFKAKSVAFRERNFENGESAHFLSF